MELPKYSRVKDYYSRCTTEPGHFSSRPRAATAGPHQAATSRPPLDSSCIPLPSPPPEDAAGLSPGADGGGGGSPLPCVSGVGRTPRRVVVRPIWDLRRGGWLQAVGGRPVLGWRRLGAAEARAAGAADGPSGGGGCDRRRPAWLRWRACCLQISDGGVEGLVVSSAAPPIRSVLTSPAGGGGHLFCQRWSA